MVKNLPPMQEMRVPSLDQEDPLEKEMATHFSILAREIAWTEELGRLPSMGSQKSQTRLKNFSFFLSVVKNLPANSGVASSILESGRSPGERNGNPLQYSCLGNSMDRGAWRATVHGVTKQPDMTWPLNNNFDLSSAFRSHFGRKTVCYSLASS